jgi:hypothetical protein
MAGYLGKAQSTTQVDGYTTSEADSEFVNDPNGVITVDGSNVGIGTSNPTSTAGWGRLLEVSGTTNAAIKLTETDVGSSDFSLGVTSGSLRVWDEQASAWRMTIDSSGNLLVGTTSSVSGVANFAVHSTSKLTFESKRNTTSAASHIGFYNPNGQVGYISTTGSSTSYITSSDYRLKEDWQPMSGSIDRIKQLKPCNFAWKADGSRVDGFLAHEAQDVVPEAVTGTKDAMRTEEYEVTPAVYEDVIVPAVLDDEGNEIEPERTEQRLVEEAVMGEREVPDYQGIDQSKLVPLLTAALQEAIGRIETLEAEVATLKGAE